MGEERCVILIEATEENKESLADIAMSMYIGEKCPYCGLTFESLDDLRDAVAAPENRTAHRECWEMNSETL